MWRGWRVGQALDRSIGIHGLLYARLWLSGGDVAMFITVEVDCEYGKLLSEERNGARNKLEKVQVKLSEAIRVISAGPWFDGKDEWIDSAKAMMTERTVAE